MSGPSRSSEVAPAQPPPLHGGTARAQGLPSSSPSPPYRERARQQRAWVVTVTLLRGLRRPRPHPLPLTLRCCWGVGWGKVGASCVSGAQNHKSLLLRVPACHGPPQEQTRAAVVGEDRALRGPGAGLGAKASCYISPRAPRGVSIAPHSLWPPAHHASPRMGAPSGCPALLWALMALLSAGTAGKGAAPYSPCTAEVAPACP